METTTAKRGAPRRPWIGWLQRLAPLIVLAFLILLWEVSVIAFEVPRFLLPRPSEVFIEFLDRPWLLIDNLLYTTLSATLGFGLAVVVAVPLSIIIAYSRPIEGVVYPYLVITRVIPIIAIAPLLGIWLGFGIAPKVFIAFLISFFPIVVNMVLGLRSPDREYINLLRSLNASERQTFRKVRIPFSLPLVFAAFRIAAPAAVIGSIVAEFVASNQGLGYLLLLAKGYLDTPLIFMAIVASSILGITMFALVVFVEKRVLYWHAAHDA